MAERWRVLSLLFCVRTAMAFQFASIGALGPLVADTFQIDAASVGFLIGLYLSPGLVFALPGGAIGRFFGDKRAVLAGLALMFSGGLISTLGNSWDAQIVGRAVAGVGGVILNVLMSKMVTDWFEGQEIATAMAVFVNSWPAGIALALLGQPFAAASGGIEFAFALTSILSLAGFGALLFLYHQPAETTAGQGTWPIGQELICIVVAGTIWGLFNGAFAMVFGFGPILLTERGWELSAASSATSLAVWISALSVPAGGILADRTGRPNTVMVIGLALSALALMMLPRLDQPIAVLVVIGLVIGIPVGAIMSLPSRVLKPQSRAMGMGIFFTFFYIFVVAAPLVAGELIDRLNWEGAAVDLGAAMFATAIIMLIAFERVAKSMR